ncbi:MAG TPA: HEAT repeat domain-containing protein [Rhodoferax sp.]|nr:HEAT repeat domain-containing protein [Rhodoferax sp.]
MSHSLKDPKRAWDAGMRDDDLVSIVVFEQSDSNPIDLKQVSPVHFIGVKDMRQAFVAGQVAITQPKGVEEGSEIRVLWTCAVANQRSVISIADSARLGLMPVSETRRQSIQLSRNKGTISLLPQAKIGDTVLACQIVAAVVPVSTQLPCPPPVTEGYFIGKLASVNLSERYAAAKALRYRGYTAAKPTLESRMTDAEEDIYVQLEAAAALAAYDDPAGWAFMEHKLHSPSLAVALETQLETIIVASEIPKQRSEKLLIDVLRDTQRDAELRAGAAWALGQFVSTESAVALAETFNASPLEIKMEAARALLRIAEPQIPQLIDLLKNGDPSQRDGLAWVLARTGKFNPANLLAGADENLRRWVSYIVGTGKEKFDHNDVQAICQADSQVYFAASVLWQIVASWVNDLKEY